MSTVSLSRDSRVRVVVATTVLLSFISFWRAAAIVLADLGSTAFYVGGLDVARRWCEGHPDTGAILLPEGSAQPMVIGRISVPSVPSVP